MFPIKPSNGNEPARLFHVELPIYLQDARRRSCPYRHDAIGVATNMDRKRDADSLHVLHQPPLRFLRKSPVHFWRDEVWTRKRVANEVACAPAWHWALANPVQACRQKSINWSMGG